MDDRMEIKAQDYDQTDDTPEKKLIRAIFFKAIADLSPHIPREVRRETIQWFHQKADGVLPEEKGYYSFSDICDELDFTKCKIRKIMKHVELAQQQLDIDRMMPKGYSFKAMMYGKVH